MNDFVVLKKTNENQKKVAIKIRTLALAYIVFYSFFQTPQIDASALDSYELETINISQKPSDETWRAFMKSSSQFRSEFWQYYAKSGKKLRDWSWEWRLGWLKTCILESNNYCSDIFKEALSDHAVIVRAEAASLLGERFDASQNTKIIQLLSSAYKSKQNSRNGKPLFVQFRILYAIKQIGGSYAVETANKLAAIHPATANYLEKLTIF